jgi:hypothetical protein
MKSWLIAQPNIIAGAKGIDTFLRSKPHNPPIIQAVSMATANCINTCIEDPKMNPSFTSPNPILPLENKFIKSSIKK